MEVLSVGTSIKSFETVEKLNYCFLFYFHHIFTLDKMAFVNVLHLM